MNINPHKQEIMDMCAKECILGYKEPIKNIIQPSRKQLSRWGYSKHSQIIKNRIKQGNLNIEDKLGIWTHSFIQGIRDSGMFMISSNYMRLSLNSYPEFLMDLKEVNMPFQLSKICRDELIGISKCNFLYYGIENKNINYTEYLAGIFTACNIINLYNCNWLVINLYKSPNPNKIIGILNNYKISFKIINNKIFISPFYGALFFKKMPQHSANKIINIKKPGIAIALGLIYWNKARNKGQPVAPVKKGILPFSLSYATYFNRKILNKNMDINQLKSTIGIIEISNELKNLLQEWIASH